jgi:NAD-dependent deacetylase
VEAIKKLQQLIDGAQNIVFFGGAGVSTESKIPDFRSTDGLYNQKYPYPPEVILSHSFFERFPAEFFRFYRDKMIYPDALPNPAHLKLAQLEQAGKLKAVITQNIDGLHQAAGSRNVLELHGSLQRNYCVRCGKRYSLQDVLESSGVPQCDCGGIIRPDIVMYEETLDNTVLRRSISHLQQADLLIVGGTSLGVYPAAGLLDHFEGSSMVLINRDPTPYDNRADLILHEKIGHVLGQIKV